MLSGKIRSTVGLAVLLMATVPITCDAQTYVVRRLDEGSVKGYNDVHVSRAAMPGTKVRVWYATLTNPDCSSAGTMTTQILDHPHHGHVEVAQDKVYPNFIAPNPRVICDKQKVDGVEAYYTADADFHGHDRIVLRNATSEGRVRRVLVDVDVQ